MAQGDLLAAPQRALDDPADGEATEVIRCIEVGHQRLKRRRRVAGWGRDGLDDRIEEGAEIGVLGGHPNAGDAATLAGDRRDDGELDVMVIGIEVEEQLVDLVDNLSHAGVRAVDLVDNHHCRQPAGQRLG